MANNLHKYLLKVLGMFCALVFLQVGNVRIQFVRLIHEPTDGSVDAIPAESFISKNVKGFALRKLTDDGGGK